MLSLLTKSGLNLHAVFNLDALPRDLLVRLEAFTPHLRDYAQLILVGHGGRRLWDEVQSSTHASDPDPIDTFTRDAVTRYFGRAHPRSRYRLLYPGQPQTLPLQELGTLAGWHHASPFRIGLNATWGSWFAYRAAVIADTTLDETPRDLAGSPCEGCRDKQCLAPCPAGAVTPDDLDLSRCIEHRRSEESCCASQCLSRLACPAGAEHRYTPEQIRYHYGRSLATIRAASAAGDGDDDATQIATGPFDRGVCRSRARGRPE